jgi:PAS domain S-box-containing protein
VPSPHDELPVGIAVSTRDRAVVSVNARLARMMGVAAEDAVGKDWASFVHPHDRARCIDEWQRAVAAMREVTIDCRVVRPDGRVDFWRVDITPRDAAGNEWISAHADVTLQRESLVRLFMQAPAAIAILRGPDFVYELSNDMNQRFLGGRQVVGKSVREAFPEGMQQGLVALVDSVYRTGEPYVTNEIPVKVVEADGTLRDAFVAGTYQPLRDAAGTVEGVMAFAYEVTDQVEARERQKFLAEAGTALASSLDYVATIDRAVELAVPRLADGCFVDVVTEDGSTKRFAAAGKASEGAATFSVPLVVHGERFGVMTFERAAPYDDDDRGLGEALAARVALHVENARLYAAATAANRTKDEFLATVSHELRTPLSSILGWASLVRASPGDEKAVGKGLEIIERNARSQLRLVEDLLDLSRVVRGEMRLTLSTFSLSTLAREVVETVAPSANAKQIALTLRAHDDAFRLVADPDRLRQVMWNLLANAVKFTQNGGTVELALERGAGAVTIVVRDSGRGMDPSFVPQAFVPFRQADGRTTTGASGGVGLGLAIVRHIVEAHGGHVSAESEGVGKGCTFRATLPVASIARRVDETARHAKFVDRARRLDAVRILVVEDDPDGRELVELTLSREGADVRVAPDAYAALALLESERAAFDVVLSDIGLPERDGYWLAREIKQRRPSQTLVALTAFGRPDDVKQALDAGFAAHLTKPVDPNELVQTLIRWTEPA